MKNKKLKPGQFLVKLLKNDKDFKLAKNDILVATDAPYDEDKVIIEYRVSDNYDPMCSQYRIDVKILK